MLSSHAFCCWGDSLAPAFRHKAGGFRRNNQRWRNGVERQLAAGAGIAVGNEFAGLFMRHEAEVAEAIERQMRKGVVDHQMVDIPVGNAGLPEGRRARDLERA